MYCRECGSKIDEKSNFCIKCGTKLTLVQPQNQNAAEPEKLSEKERVLWVFQGQRKFSMFKMQACYAVFMEDKILLAHMTPELTKAENAKASKEIKETGKGFFKGSAAMIRYWSDYYKKYYGMNSRDILAEDPSNLMIEYKNINRVLFKGFSDNTSYDENGTSTITQGKLNLFLANGETIKLLHSYSADQSSKEILAGIFGSRLKYKR